MYEEFELRLKDLEARHREQFEAYKKLQDGLEVNTKVTKELKFSVDRMYEWFDAAEGAFKVLEALGKLAKPLAAITALIAGIAAGWASIKK